MAILSLAHLTAIDAKPVELIDAAKAGGFDAVGIRLLSGAHTPLPLDLIGNRPAIAEVKAHLAATGIFVLDVEAFSLTPAPDFDRFERALETAAEIGATRLLTNSQDPDEERFLGHFVRLADLAAQYGIRVGLEFISYFAVATAADALRILRRAGHPNAGLLLDALHLSRSGGDPDDLGGLTLADYAYAQLCDAHATRPPDDLRASEARTDRLPLGEGALWLDRLLDVLPEGVPIGIEAPVKAHAHLPVVDRGRLAGQAARAFLSARHAAVAGSRA